MRRTFLSRFMLIITATLATATHAVTITLPDLLAEMTDLRVLCTLPEIPFETIQFSSYDRQSTAPYADGWFANSDGFGNEPIPNFLEVLEAPASDRPGRYLMADVQGPGAIVRTWCAVNAGKGLVEIYLDDETTPTISGPAEQVLRRRYALLANKDTNTDGGIDQYDASYFPVPFAKRLRMIWIGTHHDLHFYHVNVRRYTAPADVERLTPEAIAAAMPQIESTDTFLRDAAPPPAGEGSVFKTTAGPEAYVPLLELEGSGIITSFALSITADDLWRAPRQVILEGYFDNAPQPQIEAPLGDFFGAGPGITPFSTLPLAVAPNGRMTCRFPMPFTKSARFMIRNLGAQAVTIAGGVHIDRDTPAKDLLQFRAKWRANHDMIAGGGADSRDLPFLTALGKGVFAGCAIMIRNAVPNVGDYIWWGEGDEKIYVDSGDFPDWFGTGSEDYFNYSWGTDRLFDYAYCAQPMAFGSGGRGFVVNNRFHITDRIPFSNRFSFAMELMHHTRVDHFSYARIVYYYAPPETVDDHVRLSHGNVLPGIDYPDYGKPPREGRHADAVILQAETVFGPDQPGLETRKGSPWSAGTLLVFTPPAPGAAIAGAFTIPRDGRYTLVITTARTPRSGTLGVQLDGKPLGGAIDLFEPYVTLSRDMAIGGLQLTAGKHTLTLTSTGKNANATGSELGVDLVWFHEEE